MTSQKQQQNRVAELERKSGSKHDEVYIWHDIYRPAVEGEDEPQITSAFGRGWSANREAEETNEDFKKRCVLVAAEAGVEISYDD